MKLLKAIFDFYINSSIHVALAVCAMAYVTLIPYDEFNYRNVLSFLFFATISGYNFVKYFGLAKFHHRSLANWLRIIQLFSALAFLLMLYYMIRLNSESLILISIMALVTFLYAIPLIPKQYIFDEQQNLREVGGLKVYIIALVWSLVTVLLPVLDNEIQFSADIMITLLQRFSLVIVLMLPFEIRDMHYDSLKLATIPQKIGVKKTKIIAGLLLLVFYVLEFFKDELRTYVIVSNLIIVIIIFSFVLFSSENKSKYYTSFWVEAIPIIWLLLLFIFI